MSVIERPGFRLNYQIEGDGLPTIVIGSHIYYPRTFSKNLKKHLRLIYLDQRAFSETLSEGPVEELFALEHIVGDIEALRLHLGLDKVIIMGHSVHAFMAQEYARRHPENVSHVVIIANSPFAGPKLFEAADRYFAESVCPARKTALTNNLAHEDGFDRDPFISRMLMFGPMIWYDYAYDARSLWEGVKLHSVGASFVWGKMFLEYESTPTHIPTFLALGRYDYWNPPHLWEDYRSQFTNLTIRVFESSSHTPQLEEAEFFNQELIQWLKGHN